MSSYDEIADEYYLERHITCRNFDLATANSIYSYKQNLPENGLVLELGSGKGRIGEYLGIDQKRVIELDLSRKMLRLSPREESEERIQSDALNLPFKSKSFSMVAAFLYDPYNIHTLYHEISRVLSNDGVFIGTLPQFEWGKALRKIRGYEFQTVKFIMNTGDCVILNSFLMDDCSIIDELNSAKMKVLMLADLCLPENVHKISPDIVSPANSLGLDPNALSVIKLIVAKKHEVI